MRRTGNLIERIADVDNIRVAFLRASRGRRHTKIVHAFSMAVEEEVFRIRAGLLSGAYAWGPYHRFTVYDPKERIICAAPFRDRVAQHAMMALCEPSFESFQIFDSYACRKGKGLDGAFTRAQCYARVNRWYLKLDVRKYFPSIDHRILQTQLKRRFKDARLLALFSALIEGYCDAPGKGIPIGNLTSQYFANHYLAMWDHYAKEILKAAHYVRYMDDFILWSDSKEQLKAWAETTRTFLQECLSLELRPICLNACSQGMTFLGYRIFPQKTLLARRSRTRFRRKLCRYQYFLDQEIWDERETARHVEPLLAFVKRAPNDKFPRMIMESFGLCPRDRTV